MRDGGVPTQKQRSEWRARELSHSTAVTTGTSRSHPFTRPASLRRAHLGVLRRVSPCMGITRRSRGEVCLDGSTPLTDVSGALEVARPH